MELNLRQAIVERVKEMSEQDLQEMLDDSIGGDERVLPGLGVLFEMIWPASSAEVKKQIVTTLHNHLHSPS